MALPRSILFFLPLIPWAASASPAPVPVSFNRDIRPVMSNTCFHCHGPDASHRKAGLRLDLREEALKPAKSGELPIVPGKPGESEIIKRLFATDESDLMPPPEEHKPLTPEQKQIFSRWVAEGAIYEPHWAYTPLVRPELPTPVDVNWARNPIDHFIRARQEAANMSPAPEAPKRTLLRRLELDLTGLPPSLKDLDAFLADPSPDALERQVDRLLASPHYGERMAVAWLDLVRFSDTVGYHGDQNQRIFPYRDYVIEAYNQNLPFDDFAREQIAGDLLPGATPRQLTATGFNRLNMMTREGGAQPAEYLAKYGADRTRVVGTVFLGSTFGCAECHDHKFDPITAKDFYSLQAFFADVKQWGVYSEYGYTPNPELRGYNNDYPFPPELEVENRWMLDKDARRTADQRILIAEAAAKRAVDPAATEAFEQWRKSIRRFLEDHPDGWAAQPSAAFLTENATAGTEAAGSAALTATTGGTPLETAPQIQQDGSISLPQGKPEELSIEFQPGDTRVAALRLELLPMADQAVPHGTITLSASLLRKGAEKAGPVDFHFADTVTKKDRYANGYEIPGILSGWDVAGPIPGSAPSGVWLPREPLAMTSGDRLVVSIKTGPFRNVRVSWSPLAPADPARPGPWMEMAGQSLADPAAAQLAILNEAWLTGTAANPEALRQYQELARERRQYNEGRAKTMVTQAMEEPLPVRVLPRGNWQDLSGDPVAPATPHFLPGPEPSPGGRLSRLDLANWITSPENPLTARTVMNRLWKQFFGTGLSAVVDDLGAQGEPPSHPELLDWLAAEFRDSGWNIKHMVHLMVTSATYRQESSQRAEYLEADPGNRLLTWQNPRRLDAEFVRDNALHIAGLLNPETGGPSIKPWQPPGYYANLQFPNRDYTADTDGGQWRRGVYMHWQRTFLHPMLANFDAPMRDECAAARMVSNTPQQALTLLNDPNFAEAARVLAQRVLASSADTDTARIRHVWELALARPPLPAEEQSLLTFLENQRLIFRKSPEEAAKVISIGKAPQMPAANPAELAAWTAACRVVLNLHETITRY